MIGVAKCVYGLRWYKRSNSANAKTYTNIAREIKCTMYYCDEIS